jgi:hypothetical protein
MNNVEAFPKLVVTISVKDNFKTHYKAKNLSKNSLHAKKFKSAQNTLQSSPKQRSAKRPLELP